MAANGADPGGVPSPLELEHVIGYAGASPQSLQPHVADADKMIYHVSSLVVIASVSDPHDQRLLRGHTGDVSCLAQSADGEYCASGQAAPVQERSGEAHVFVWSSRDGVPIYRLPGLRGRATSVSFSRDNRFVAGSDNEARLLVWDMHNGQVVLATRLDRAASFVAWGAVLARENKRGAARPSTYRLCLAAGPALRELTLDFNVKAMQFEIESEPMTMPSSGLQREYNVGVFAPGDGYVLAGTTAGELCVFATAAENAATAAANQRGPSHAGGLRRSGVFRACVPVSSGKGGVLCVAVDGPYVWAGAGDGKVKRFRGSDQAWQVEAEAMVEGRVVSLGLTADRGSLLAATSAGKVYRLHAGSLAAELLYAAHPAPVVAAAFGSAHPDRVATAAEDGTVRVWDLNSYQEVFCATRPGQRPTCVHVGADDGPAGTPGLVLSGWEDGAVYCHDPAAAGGGAGGLLWTIAPAHAGAVTGLAFSELAVLSAGQDGKLRAWSLGGRRCEYEFAEHQKAVSALVVDASDPTRVHTCGLDQLVVTLDLKRHRRVTYHALREGQFTAMCQRREGDQELLTATNDGMIFVWDVDEAGPVGMLREPRAQRLNSVSLSPSGKYLAVTTEQGAELQIWDIASGKPGTNTAPVAVGVAHAAAAKAAVWSPDEKQIITVGKDGLVAVWNWFGE